VRSSLGGVRTGHAGTLDPFATGLLLVLVGRATKAQSALMALPKRYDTVAQLGALSSTGDTEGEITHTGRLPPDPPALPTGELRQRPPIYSAVKIGGERAYKRARRGERFEMPERIVTVTRFTQVWRDPDAARGLCDRMRLGDLRALADRRPRRRLLPDAEAHGDRPVPGARRGRAAAAPGAEVPRTVLARPTADLARAGARRDLQIGFAAVKVTRLPDVERGSERSVAVGTFDGVHLGHREVISGSDSVLTFDPHPVSVVAPQHTPKLLTTLARMAELVAELGVRELIVIPFDAEFAKRSASEFIDDVLVGALGAKQVAIGENFRFGHKAQGDARLLSADERFATVVHPLLEVDGEIVSSSHIRGLVLAGEVAEADRLLGANFELRGEVVHGDERGRELGFPTANLIPDEALVCPGHGVYACVAVTEGLGVVPAAVSIGVRPTFKTGRAELIEAFLLDFEGDLYASQLRLRFLARLRGERRFEDPKALIEQMHLDVQRTREIAAETGIRAGGG
jgi:riboflavin kinase/FMN adenylyltransferase